MWLVSRASAFWFFSFGILSISQAHTETQKKFVFFHTCISPGFVFAIAAGSAGLNQDRTSWKSFKPQYQSDCVDSEAVPPTNCEAMYQAAVSKRADTFPSGVPHCVHGHEYFPAARCRVAYRQNTIYASTLFFLVELRKTAFNNLQDRSTCILCAQCGTSAGHRRSHRSWAGSYCWCPHAVFSTEEGVSKWLHGSYVCMKPCETWDPPTTTLSRVDWKPLEAPYIYHPHVYSCHPGPHSVRVQNTRINNLYHLLFTASRFKKENKKKNKKLASRPNKSDSDFVGPSKCLENDLIDGEGNVTVTGQFTTIIKLLFK